MRLYFTFSGGSTYSLRIIYLFSFPENIESRLMKKNSQKSKEAIQYKMRANHSLNQRSSFLNGLQLANFENVKKKITLS